MGPWAKADTIEAAHARGTRAWGRRWRRDNGFSAAPPRYLGQGRETIDRIRDLLGDAAFVAFCVGTALKYADRAGAKGDAAGDLEKRTWYTQMALATLDIGPDPRAGRSGFVSYQRLPAPSECAQLATLVDVAHLGGGDG